MVFTTQLVAHIVSKRAHYTLDNFHIIGNAMQDPLIMAVPEKSPIKNLDDLIKTAKAKSMTAAVNGIGSDDFVAAKKFEQQTGVKFNLLPTKGSTEQKAMILGGHIDASFMNLSQLQAQHKAGKDRIIAILADKRSEILPNIKTAAEQGYPVSMTATRGFVAPASISKPIWLGSLIGTVIGILPGEGATIAAFVSYNVARRRSKNPQLFGKGSPEGIAAAEAGNNGCVGGSLVPTLTLGALILGLILGPIAETGFAQALIIGHVSYSIFFTRPQALALWIIIILLLITPMIQIYRQSRQEKKEQAIR